MALPSYWQPIPSDGVWDPVTNSDPLSGDWIQLVEGMDQPGGGMMMTKDDKSDTLVGLIPGAKQYSAELGIVGAAYADAASPFYLHRINPLPHPNGDLKMRANSVDMVGYNPFPKNQAPDPDTDPEDYRPFQANPYLPAPDDAEGKPALRLPGYTYHSRLKTTIKFKSVNYPVLEDSEMFTGEDDPERLSEVYRSCAFFDEVSPLLDVIQATGGGPFLQWADSAAGGAAPTAGTAIQSEFVEYIQRANLVAIWYGVPYEYIVDVASSEYIPKKIFDVIGKVNLGVWYGFPEDTLRFEAPRFRKYTQAAVRTVPGTNMAFVFDIILPFSYVNPAMAPISGGGTPQAAGWNAYVFSKTGKYYAVERIATGDQYFPRIGFDRIFQHVLAP